MRADELVQKDIISDSSRQGFVLKTRYYSFSHELGGVFLRAGTSKKAPQPISVRGFRILRLSLALIGRGGGVHLGFDLTDFLDQEIAEDGNAFGMAQFFGINEIGIEAWPFEFRQNADQIAVSR